MQSEVRLLQPPGAWSPWVFIPGIVGDVATTYEHLLQRLDIGCSGAIGLDYTPQLLALCHCWSELISEFAQLLLKHACPLTQSRAMITKTAAANPASASQVDGRPPDSERAALDMSETCVEGLCTLKLVGYSFGCRIAHAVSCLLKSMGYSVCLMLIDGPIGGPIGSFEEAVRANSPHSLGGRLVALLAAGGDGLVEECAAADVYVASEARVGIEVIQEASPTTTIVQLRGSHQGVLKASNVAAVAAVLAEAGGIQTV